MKPPSSAQTSYKEVRKHKEQLVDFRKRKAKEHTPVYISGAEVEQVSSFRFQEATSQKICLGHHASPPSGSETVEFPKGIQEGKTPAVVPANRLQRSFFPVRLPVSTSMTYHLLNQSTVYHFCK